MREVKLTFTLTIRPLRWLRNALLAAACLPLALSPGRAGRASADIAPEVLYTPAQREQFRMADFVEAEFLMRSRATPREARDIARAVVDESARQRVDPLFVLALIEAESGFDLEAVSRTGARGLMQVVPGTARRLGLRRSFDPVENVRAGIRYLGDLRRSGFGKRGGPPSVLLAYNQGPGGALAYFRGETLMPDEAAAFVPRVVAGYRRYLERGGGDPRAARDLFREGVHRG